MLSLVSLLILLLSTFGKSNENNIKRRVLCTDAPRFPTSTFYCII